MWRGNVWKRCKFMMTDATQLACTELVSHYNLDMGKTFESSSDAGVGGRSIAMAGGVELRSTICNHSFESKIIKSWPLVLILNLPPPKHSNFRWHFLHAMF